MKKRVLIFSDWFAPGYRAGGPIQSLINLTMAMVDFDFFVVTSDTDHHADQPYPGIAPNQWLPFAPHIQVWYGDGDNSNAQVFKRLIHEIDPQVIYLNSLFSPKYTLVPLRLLRSLPNDRSVVVAPRGMLKSAALREKALKKSIFLWLARRLGWYKGVLWHVTNATELLEVRRHFGDQAQGIVADNLTQAPLSEWPSRGKKTGHCRLLCLARISPEKGIEEALRFLEGKNWNGQLEIDFVGAQQNPSFLEKCKAIENGLLGVKCNFLGEFPTALIDQNWIDYHFLYLPTRGENFGHAIAESVNHAVPAIISDRTPWRGLREKNMGWDLPLEKANFVKAIEEAMAMDQAQYDHWSKCTWNYAKELYYGSDRLLQTRTLLEAALLP